MGIKGLTQLIGDCAPAAIKENEIKNFFGRLTALYITFYPINIFVWSNFLGRKVAIDASMSIYQFLIAVRSEGAQLTSADGETTRYAFTSSQFKDNS